MGAEHCFRVEGCSKRIYVDSAEPPSYPWDIDTEPMQELSKGYGWPEQGHEAEVESLAWHSKQGDGVRRDPPTATVSERIKETIADWLGIVWEIPDDFDSREAFLRAVKRLDWTSSPGVPYCYSHPTNGQLFGVVDGEPDEGRLEEVWLMVKNRLQDGSCDPIRLFVKTEPHKEKKILLKRWRLISSVSVVDQIIDHMLFGEMNDKLVDSWFETPLKIGWTPYKGGYRLIPKGPVLAIDKSSWDWTVMNWLVEIVMECRKSMARGRRFDDWARLVAWRYSCLFQQPLFQTSGGVQLRQLVEGVMKSGCVNTITDNSIMQLILHVRVCVELGLAPGWFWALGDDTLQQLPSNPKLYMDLLRQFCIVKQAVAKPEFAGFCFDTTPEPMYRGKHAYNLLHANPKFLTEFKRAYKLLYYKSKHLPKLLPYIQGAGLSDSQAREIWEGDDE